MRTDADQKLPCIPRNTAEATLENVLSAARGAQTDVLAWGTLCHAHHSYYGAGHYEQLEHYRVVAGQ